MQSRSFSVVRICTNGMHPVSVEAPQLFGRGYFKCEFITLPTREPDLTSILCCEDRHIYPNRELSSSDGRKPSHEENVFHRDDVYSATKFPGSTTGVTKKQRTPSHLKVNTTWARVEHMTNTRSAYHTDELHLFHRWMRRVTSRVC
jgi:hypothetical protein